MIEQESETLSLDTETVDDVSHEKSMEDSIRDTLRELQSKESANNELGDKDQEHQRDSSGKFVSDSENSDANDTQKKLEDAATEVKLESKPAPNSWRKEAAEKWASLPKEVQEEVERREGDIFRGIDVYKQAAQRAQAYDQAVKPYDGYLSELGVDAPRAIGLLLNADYALRKGDESTKMSLFSKLAADYGIDLAKVQEVPKESYELSQIKQQVNQMQGLLQSQAQADQQRKEQEVNTQLAQFAADPLHKHFDAVRVHMAALLQDGLAADLKSAYEQAVYANPQTRSAILAEQQAADRAEAAKKAQTAKKAASINIRSRPAMQHSEPVGPMEDSIRQLYRQLTSA